MTDLHGNGYRVNALTGERRAPISRIRRVPALDWVIVGGESGHGARPMDPDWARSIRDQCDRAGVAFFMKQMAKKAPIPPDLLIRQQPAGD